MAVVTMRQLLESGVHFGHQTRRWNPKMKRFILTERNGIYIIDLQGSLSYIDRAYEFVNQTVAHGGTVLFVGTKKQAQEAVAQQATRVGMPYVNNRWLGGMLTNFSTVHQRLERLKELEDIDFDDVAGSGMTKKELLSLRREKDKLERTLGGIRNMEKVPSAIWVVDTKKEHIAVKEARKLGIPVIAILDTNCDPDEVDYPVPGNDDAIRAVALLTRVIADAVADGLRARAGGRRPVKTMPSRWPSGRRRCSVRRGEAEAVARSEAEAAAEPKSRRAPRLRQSPRCPPRPSPRQKPPRPLPSGSRVPSRAAAEAVAEAERRRSALTSRLQPPTPPTAEPGLTPRPPTRQKDSHGNDHRCRRQEAP